MKKLIYIVRHGETDFNRRNVVQGSGVDSDLNELGKAQATAFFQHYRHIAFDKVYISKLKRTQQSVASFIEKGLPFESLEGLNEISWGNYEGQEHSAIFHQEYLTRVDDWKAGHLDIPVTGGETPREMEARQRIAWDYIRSKEAEQTILICMHGRALKGFLCLLLGIPYSHMDDFDHQNLGLYQLTYEGGACQLLKRNDNAHLEGLQWVHDLT